MMLILGPDMVKAKTEPDTLASLDEGSYLKASPPPSVSRLNASHTDGWKNEIQCLEEKCGKTVAERLDSASREVG